MEEGFLLQAVLSEFLDDVDNVLAKSGRFISHHFELDAGIVAREIMNAGLSSRISTWMEAAQRGFCTMSPLLGAWLRECLGQQTAMELNRNILTLPKTVDALRTIGVGQWSYHWKQHSAGGDARIHVEVYRAVCDLLQRVDETKTTNNSF